MIYYTYPGFRNKALTISYDDGLWSDVHLLEILNRYGSRGNCKEFARIKLEKSGLKWYAYKALQEMGAAAVGLNCSVGPDQLEAVVAGMKEVATVPIIAKPNAS